MEQKDYETLTCETQEFRGYSQGKTIVDQFYVDQDYNVPDAKSDVQRVILNEGTLRIEEQKIVDNYIRISGKIQFRMLYVRMTLRNGCHLWKEDSHLRSWFMQRKCRRAVYLSRVHRRNLP